MKKLMRALGVALVGAVVCSTPALALDELRIGQSRMFSLGDDMASTMSAVVGTRVGHDVVTTAGAVRRITASRYLVCGMYFDQTTPRDMPGFIMVHDRSTNAVAVLAPLTHDQQERHGCWPGERERINASLRNIARMAKVSRGRVTGPGMTSTTTVETGQ